MMRQLDFETIEHVLSDVLLLLSNGNSCTHLIISTNLFFLKSFLSKNEGQKLHVAYIVLRLDRVSGRNGLAQVLNSL